MKEYTICPRCVLRLPGTAPGHGSSTLDARVPFRSIALQSMEPSDLLERKLREARLAYSGAISIDLHILSSISKPALSTMFTIACRGKSPSPCESRASEQVMNSATQTPVDFEQLVEGLGDAVVVADASGAITVWNPAAERFFGFTQAKAL